jgi:hypothetical protein
LRSDRLAKEIATVDLLSGGRFVLGIGYGWNREEMENHGIDVKRRRERVRETMLAMQALWANEVAEYHGEFVRFEPSWQWPKPVQQPRPTVLLGGAPGPTLFSHVAEYADGWLPIAAPARGRLGASRGRGAAATRAACTSCRWACCRAKRSSPTTASSGSPRRHCGFPRRRGTLCSRCSTPSCGTCRVPDPCSDQIHPRTPAKTTRQVASKA